MDSKIIICCSGPQSRWGNYLSVPKHFAPVDGKPLLNRTVDLLVQRGYKNIIITALDVARYHVEGATTYCPTGSILPNTAIGHSAEFWSTTGRTIIMLGDVYFSGRVLDALEQCQPEELTWIGRAGCGKSGHVWGELFAFSIPLSQQAKFIQLIQELKVRQANGETGRAGGWELYRHFQGLPLFDPNNDGRYQIYNNFIDIDDESEDFDTPQEYLSWCKKNRPTLWPKNKPIKRTIIRTRRRK